MNTGQKLIVYSIACAVLLKISVSPALASADQHGEPWLAQLDATPQGEHYKAVMLEIKRQNPRILFVGDSITARWMTAARAFWDNHFAPLGAANAGISGETTEKLLGRIQDHEFDGLSPRTIVLMIGTNDIPYTAEEITRGISEVISELHAVMPSSKIILLGVLPRGPANGPFRGKLRQVDQFLSTMQKDHNSGNFTYYDFSASLLDENGDFRAGFIMPDQVHITEPAYVVLGNQLLGVLSSETR